MKCIECKHFSMNPKNGKGLCGISGEVISSGFNNDRFVVDDDDFCWHSMCEKAKRQHKESQMKEEK